VNAGRLHQLWHSSSSTTSTTPRVRMPRHVVRLVAWLVVDYFAYAVRPGALARSTARHAAHRVTRRRLLRLRRASGCRGSSRDLSRGSSCRSSSTTSPTPRDRVPRHVVQLVTRLIVSYFAYDARPGALARCAGRHAAHRAAHPRLLHLRCTTGCLGMSCGLSHGSSLTTSLTSRVRVTRHVMPLVVDYFAYGARLGASARRADHRVARCRLLHLTQSRTPRVRVPRHIAWFVTRLVIDYSASRKLLVDYFAYAARPGASAHCVARRAARCAARRRLIRLRHASGCLGTLRGPSRGSSSTTPCAATSSCGHTGSTSATPCVSTTCLAATLALLRVRRAPPRRRLPVASRRPFISTSFPS
jgi:hypothetical protein